MRSQLRTSTEVADGRTRFSPDSLFIPRSATSKRQNRLRLSGCERAQAAPQGKIRSGERQGRPFHFSFDSTLKSWFSRVANDLGPWLVAGSRVRPAAGLGQFLSDNPKDEPRSKNTRSPLPDLPRQSIYCHQAEYEDLNDVKRLEQDATFRVNWLEEDS
jgi:hypothetical protein